MKPPKYGIKFLRWLGKFKGKKIIKEDYDTYFMSIAFKIAMRSIDPNTMHGAIIVSKDKRIIATGYNGPIQNSIDNDIPLDHNKYFYIIHSEQNAIINFYGSKEDIQGSTIYITGEPCCYCLKEIIQKGITEIVYGFVGSNCIDTEDIKHKKHIIKHHPNITIRKYNDVEKIKQSLYDTINYIKYKTQDK